VTYLLFPLCHWLLMICLCRFVVATLLCDVRWDVSANLRTLQTAVTAGIAQDFGQFRCDWVSGLFGAKSGYRSQRLVLRTRQRHYRLPQRIWQRTWPRTPFYDFRSTSPDFLTASFEYLISFFSFLFFSFFNTFVGLVGLPLRFLGW